MSNLQTINGVIKYYANPAQAKDHGYGPRMNAAITTADGQLVRVYATVGSPEGNQLQALQKGQQVAVLVDGNKNFKGLANGVQPVPPVTGTPVPPVQAPTQYQGPTADQVESFADLLKMCHEAVHSRFEDSGLPVDQEPEILRSYVNTLYISLTR